MTAVGLTPSGPVVAENLRDLQSCAGHVGGALRRRPAPAPPLHALACLGQQVERALDGGDHARGNLRVARRRLQFGMAEKRLDHANVGPALQQVGCEAVASRWKRASGTTNAASPAS